MCDRCNPVKSLREIQEKVLPEVRKQSYCTQERNWPEFLSTLDF